VVIGIIAILIGVLLPVLGRARESARTIKCLSNLRTLGQAAIQYSFDNKGHFLPSVIWKENDGNAGAGVDFWPHLLAYKKYIPKQTITSASSPIAYDSVLVCPSVVQFTTANSLVDGVRRELSAVLDPPKLGYVGLRIDFAYGINGTSYSNSSANAYYPCTSISCNGTTAPRLKKRNNAKNHSEVVFMFDGKEWNVWNAPSVSLAGVMGGGWQANGTAAGA
jgi:type II secretory pathway pseudopilin PulG